MWQVCPVESQWWSNTFQLSAEAGSVPSSASVAPPEKLIGSPTFQVNVDAGAVMVGTGGWSPPAGM